MVHLAPRFNLVDATLSTNGGNVVIVTHPTGTLSNGVPILTVFWVLLGVVLEISAPRVVVLQEFAFTSSAGNWTACTFFVRDIALVKHQLGASGRVCKEVALLTLAAFVRVRRVLLWSASAVRDLDFDAARGIFIFSRNRPTVSTCSAPGVRSVCCASIASTWGTVIS